MMGKMTLPDDLPTFYGWIGKIIEITLFVF